MVVDGWIDLVVWFVWYLIVVLCEVERRWKKKKMMKMIMMKMMVID